MTDADDDLQQRYRQATDHDARRPAARVRQAVLTHAQMALCGSAHQDRMLMTSKQKVAANWPNWKAALVASLLLTPVVGILVSRQPEPSPEGEQVARMAPPAPKGTIPAEARPMPPAPPIPSGTGPATGKTTQPTKKSALDNQQVQPDPVGRAVAQSTTVDAPVPVAGIARMTLPSADVAKPRLGALAAKEIPEPARPDLNTLLLQAVSTARGTDVETLLTQGASVNARDASGQTALIVATLAGQADIVRHLLTFGADPDLIDRQGLTALQHARKIGNTRIEALLQPHP